MTDEKFTGGDRLDSVLRAPIEPLAAAPGSFEAISRRANHRRQRHVAAAVAAAAVVIAAVAVPVGLSLARTNNSSNTQFTDRGTPLTRLASPGVPSNLIGFKPTSLSFALQTVGWIAGADGTRRVELADTGNQGSTWTRLPDVHFPSTDAQVRFATPTIGFLFGHGLDMSRDGGQSWSKVSGGPKFISDLEIWDHVVYVLGSSCDGCSDSRLYESTLSRPTPRLVAAVPALHDAFPSLAVADQSAFVISTSPTATRVFASYNDGKKWHSRVSPCARNQSNVQVAAAGPQIIAATCLAEPTQSSAPPGPDRLFLSTDGGLKWHRRSIKLYGPDGPQHLAAAANNDFIVNSGGGKALAVTNNGGKVWRQTDPAQPYSTYNTVLNFVGVINTNLAVALITPTFTHHGSVAEFVLSGDGGRSWQVVTDFG